MTSKDKNTWWICANPNCNPIGAYNRFKSPNSGKAGSKPKCPCCKKAYLVKKYRLGLGIQIANRQPIIMEMARV
jgi:transposase-like protein